MSYKPTEQELIAYLYDELEGEERAKVEQYLVENPEAEKELHLLGGVSNLLQNIKDKEVIAPPIFLGDTRTRKLWDAPYFKTIVSIAASFVIVILVAKFSDLSVSVKEGEMRLGFGAPRAEGNNKSITQDQVQRMINNSLQANNDVLNTSWEESQKKLSESIKSNLSLNSEKMNVLVRQASTASKEQIQAYVSSLQAENMKLVKDYFTLTSGEQKQYIESLLVDFAKYLQQQRKDDLQLVQMRLNNIEQNNTAFKQETEQILTSIMTTVGNPIPSETKY